MDAEQREELLGQHPCTPCYGSAVFGWLKPRVSIRRVVEGGYSFEQHCTACNRETLFREVELRTSFGFGRVLGEGDRAFACKDCGHRFEDEPRNRRRGRGRSRPEP